MTATCFPTLPDVASQPTNATDMNRGVEHDDTTRRVRESRAFRLREPKCSSKVRCGRRKLARGWLLTRQRLRLVAAPTSKRALDLVGSIAGLLLFAPIMLVIALLIKATDRGPILYYSARIGRHGRAYLMPKFRSMFVGAKSHWHALKDEGNDLGSSVTFKRRSDPRVTWIGRILRRTSLDELPQFWSVLIGDMSMVGPRPTLEEEFPIYTSYARQRLLMKPGITCTWQVEGRGDIPFDRQLEMDLEYYQRMSIATDLSLIARTIPAVVTGKGAY
ncbi:MAG: sugar transferase [Planctomycetales bacterium]|nr:sugar transferase [Planctomycetales bacterium]